MSTPSKTLLKNPKSFTRINKCISRQRSGFPSPPGLKEYQQAESARDFMAWAVQEKAPAAPAVRRMEGCHLLVLPDGETQKSKL